MVNYCTRIWLLCRCAHTLHLVLLPTTNPPPPHCIVVVLQFYFKTLFFLQMVTHMMANETIRPLSTCYHVPEWVEHKCGVMWVRRWIGAPNKKENVVTIGMMPGMYICNSLTQVPGCFLYAWTHSSPCDSATKFQTL